MNAYELADLNDWACCANSKEVSAMLRQQADRIAELEKGEEVAGRFYWESVVDGHVMAVPSEGTPHYNKDDFPFYTTPQIKPLTDEEVWQVGRTLGYEFTNKNPNNVFLQFARAIEERHGIK